jgi:abequosyltransferase
MATENKIKISICIPTHNRAKFLAETLENVLQQATDEIEVVIVDGASSDNTKEVAEQYRQKFRNFIYYRGEKNMGVNRDMGRTIELAHGDYCWMLSDDDCLRPGALSQMLKEIQSQCEIYLCNVTVCDLFLNPLRDRQWLSAKVPERIFNLHEKNDFIEYCQNANSIGALFSYMSSIVVSRKAWNQTGYHQDFDKTAYALASSLMSFIKEKCRLKYLRTPLVFWRNDNASFQFDGGLVKRFLLDFDGYLQLADKYLLEDTPMRDAFLHVMLREHPWYTIVNVTSYIHDDQEWQDFKNKMLKFGYHPQMAQICFSLGRYKNLVSFAVMIKRKILKSHRLNQFARLLWKH